MTQNKSQNASGINVAELSTVIATAIASYLGATGAIAQAQAQSPAKPAPRPSAAQTPSKPASKPTSTGTVNPFTGQDINPDLVELIVGTSRDARLKLPKRMFDGNNRAYINGTLFQGQPNDGGRGKVQPSFFNAPAGSVVRIMRDKPRSNKWTAIVQGAKKSTGTQARGTSSTKPASTGTVTPPAKSLTSAVAGITGGKPSAKPQNAAKPAANVKNTASALEQLLNLTAAKAIAGYNAGRVNENLPENDARRYLTTSDKKSFNTQTNALKIKLPQAIEMLNERVFE